MTPNDFKNGNFTGQWPMPLLKNIPIRDTVLLTKLDNENNN